VEKERDKLEGLKGTASKLKEQLASLDGE